MSEIFLTHIHINKVRHLTDIDILLSEKERKHLILTGKNGSGKTSVLEALKIILQAITNQPRIYKTINTGLEPVHLLFNEENYIDSFVSKNTTLVYLKARRDFTPVVVKGIQKIKFKEKYNIDEKIGDFLTQHLTNLKADRSFAKDENDNEVVEHVDFWFERFEKALKNIFDDDNLSFDFDRKTYNFIIHKKNANPFDLHTLSDGYKAIMNIVAELMMRMEAMDIKVYDAQGLVLIDEIETHLHIDLQKKIMPFLTEFFPKVQFIVTTHSPFVISSISNAVVYDLENHIRIEDASGYSSEAIVEGYFEQDKFSEELKDKVEEYEKLARLDELSIEEKDKLWVLENYFDNLPKFEAPELVLKINKIKRLSEKVLR